MSFSFLNSHQLPDHQQTPNELQNTNNQTYSQIVNVDEYQQNNNHGVASLQQSVKNFINYTQSELILHQQNQQIGYGDNKQLIDQIEEDNVNSHQYYQYQSNSSLNLPNKSRDNLMKPCKNNKPTSESMLPSNKRPIVKHLVNNLSSNSNSKIVASVGSRFNNQNKNTNPSALQLPPNKECLKSNIVSRGSIQSNFKKQAQGGYNPTIVNKSKKQQKNIPNLRPQDSLHINSILHVKSSNVSSTNNQQKSSASNSQQLASINSKKLLSKQQSQVQDLEAIQLVNGDMIESNFVQRNSHDGQHNKDLDLQLPTESIINKQDANQRIYEQHTPSAMINSKQNSNGSSLNKMTIDETSHSSILQVNNKTKQQVKVNQLQIYKSVISHYENQTNLNEACSQNSHLVKTLKKLNPQKDCSTHLIPEQAQENKEMSNKRSRTLLSKLPSVPPTELSKDPCGQSAREQNVEQQAVLNDTHMHFQLAADAGIMANPLENIMDIDFENLSQYQDNLAQMEPEKKHALINNNIDYQLDDSENIQMDATMFKMNKEHMHTYSRQNQRKSNVVQQFNSLSSRGNTISSNKSYINNSKSGNASKFKGQNSIKHAQYQELLKRKSTDAQKIQSKHQTHFCEFYSSKARAVNNQAAVQKLTNAQNEMNSYLTGINSSANESQNNTQAGKGQQQSFMTLKPVQLQINGLQQNKVSDKSNKSQVFQYYTNQEGMHQIKQSMLQYSPENQNRSALEKSLLGQYNLPANQLSWYRSQSTSSQYNNQVESNKHNLLQAAKKQQSNCQAVQEGYQSDPKKYGSSTKVSKTMHSTLSQKKRGSSPQVILDHANSVRYKRFLKQLKMSKKAPNLNQKYFNQIENHYHAKQSEGSTNQANFKQPIDNKKLPFDHMSGYYYFQNGIYYEPKINPANQNRPDSQKMNEFSKKKDLQSLTNKPQWNQQSNVSSKVQSREAQSVIEQDRNLQTFLQQQYQMYPNNSSMGLSEPNSGQVMPNPVNAFPYRSNSKVVVPVTQIDTLRRMSKDQFPQYTASTGQDPLLQNLPSGTARSLITKHSAEHDHNQYVLVQQDQERANAAMNSANRKASAQYYNIQEEGANDHADPKMYLQSSAYTKSSLAAVDSHSAEQQNKCKLIVTKIKNHEANTGAQMIVQDQDLLDMTNSDQQSSPHRKTNLVTTTVVTRNQGIDVQTPLSSCSFSQQQSDQMRNKNVNFGQANFDQNYNSNISALVCTSKYKQNQNGLKSAGGKLKQSVNHNTAQGVSRNNPICSNTSAGNQACPDSHQVQMHSAVEFAHSNKHMTFINTAQNYMNSFQQNQVRKNQNNLKSSTPITTTTSTNPPKQPVVIISNQQVHTGSDMSVGNKHICYSKSNQTFVKSGVNHLNSDLRDTTQRSAAVGTGSKHHLTKATLQCKTKFIQFPEKGLGAAAQAEHKQNTQQKLSKADPNQRNTYLQQSKHESKHNGDIEINLKKQSLEQRPKTQSSIQIQPGNVEHAVNVPRQMSIPYNTKSTFMHKMNKRKQMQQILQDNPSGQQPDGSENKTHIQAGSHSFTHKNHKKSFNEVSYNQKQLALQQGVTNGSQPFQQAQVHVPQACNYNLQKTSQSQLQSEHRKNSSTQMQQLFAVQKQSIVENIQNILQSKQKHNNSPIVVLHPKQNLVINNPALSKLQADPDMGREASFTQASAHETQQRAHLARLAPDGKEQPVQVKNQYKALKRNQQS